MNDIVIEYGNTYRTIKMKLFDVKSSIYTDFDIENNDKNPKLKLVIM